MVEITKDQQEILDGMRFVAKAVSKDELRPQINLISITSWGAEATDGHRLHKFLFDHTWQSGLYRIIKNTKSLMALIMDDTGVEFPKTDSVWPDEYGMKFQELPSGKNSVDLLLKDIYKVILSNMTINHRYVLDVVDGAGWSYTPLPAEASFYILIVFRNGMGRAAIIMVVKDSRI